MSVVHFYKYQATGNDFLLVDNREGTHSFSASQISRLCNRRFGIGADGVILLNEDGLTDFRMVYYNADGSPGFCGNGCRAIVHFANLLGCITTKAVFMAHDGKHSAELLSDGNIRISLLDVKGIEQRAKGDFFITAGTEHNVRFVTNLDAYPVVEEGRKIRYSPLYPGGTNANFVELLPEGHVAFRIYERGVEDETLSSGSGATACALVSAKQFGLTPPIMLKARGGYLLVDFKVLPDGTFTDIHFVGPTQLVFETRLEIG